ncbi:hypothetical protein BDZ85DRAFT_279048 [Elsinoe ampelina]|uniref:Tubby C-terminal-like domain-containing protein n=1 Tax=Elsinoe ampelina TaxID=302913 RepID=A0A6A6GN01_9PEZI|nr:hypothetical protein BDZ85DRAFT_279048 [Elsinoe ampelina]
MASFGTGHIYKEERVFEIRCPDRFLRDIRILINGELLYSSKAETINKSLSQRKTLLDAAGQEILLVRWKTSGLHQARLIECPPGTERCQVRTSTVNPGRRVRLETKLPNDAGGEVVFACEAVDNGGLTNRFFVGETQVGELCMTESNDLDFLHAQGLDRSAWRLRVGAGVDVALVLAICFMRIEDQHAWRK